MTSSMPVTWRGGAYLLDIAYPVPDVVEGFLVGDVVHQHDALPRQTGSDMSALTNGKRRGRGLPWRLGSRLW